MDALKLLIEIGDYKIMGDSFVGYKFMGHKANVLDSIFLKELQKTDYSKKTFEELWATGIEVLEFDQAVWKTL